jgi:hypothetical protein
MSFIDFSSWGREQEQTFVVFEQRQAESRKKAMTIGGAVAGVWLLLLVGIFMGVEPEHKDMTKGMNMSNLTKKSKAAPSESAPAPEAPKAEAPKAEAPAAAPAGDKPAETAPAAPADKK